MQRLYSTLKIGLITIALIATNPHITLAGDSGRQEKAKTFNELIEEKAREKDEKGMEEIVNRQLNRLLKETKKIDSELEQCIENNPQTPEECYKNYSNSEANSIRRQKGQVNALLNRLAWRKYAKKDYEGAEATLKKELLLVSKEIESYEFGSRYCNSYRKTIQKGCNTYLSF